MHSESEELNFRKTIIASAVFHVAIFLIFTVKAAFFPSDIPAYVPAMKVDIVGLPEKREPNEKIAPISEAVPEPTKPVAKVEEKKTDDSKKDSTKANTKDILEKFKKEAKTTDILDKFKKDQTKPIAKPIAGNRVADGTSLKGLDKVEFDRYAGLVDAHVKNNWTLPEWMLSQNLTATINVKFDKNGQLIAKTFIKKSGNADFDSYVEKAIESSNPFPPPPDRLADLVAIRGITFAFPE